MVLTKADHLLINNYIRPLLIIILKLIVYTDRVVTEVTYPTYPHGVLDNLFTCVLVYLPVLHLGSYIGSLKNNIYIYIYIYTNLNDIFN